MRKRRKSRSKKKQMRIFLSAIVVLLGANLLIDLMDSNMLQLINERNESIQRAIDKM